MQMLSEYFNQIHPLPASIQEQIEGNSSVINFERNDNIDIIGKTPEHFLLIKSGIVKSVRRTCETTLITGFKGPGESLYHVASLFRDAPAKEGYKALTDAVVIALPYGVIHSLHRIHPEFFFHLFGLADRKLGDLQKHVLILSETLDQRIFSFAKYFSHVLPEIPKQQLCQFLCMSRTSLYGHAKTKCGPGKGHRPLI